MKPLERLSGFVSEVWEAVSDPFYHQARQDFALELESLDLEIRRKVEELHALWYEGAEIRLETGVSLEEALPEEKKQEMIERARELLQLDVSRNTVFFPILKMHKERWW